MFGRPTKSLSVLSTSILYTVVKERAEAGASTGKSRLVLAGALRAAVWMAYLKEINAETKPEWIFVSGVGLTGLEPVTLRLSSACSNQLSYRPGLLEVYPG